MTAPPTEPRIEAAMPTPAQRRLAESRSALEDILAPPEGHAFPRSETMRFLTGGKGRITALGLFAGLLLVKPKLAIGLLRFLPLGPLLPVARSLVKALR